MSSDTQSKYWSDERYYVMLWFLRIIGFATLTAFGAAAMPDRSFASISSWLNFEFPDSPLGYYLARNLSTMYGFVGLGILVLTTDLHRYGPLVWWLGWAAVGFGVIQLVLDAWAGLPWWWTLLEGLSTVLGGIAILGVASWCRPRASVHPA